MKSLEVVGDTIVVRHWQGQLFTHQDEDTGQLRHFDVDELWQWALAHLDQVEWIEADMDVRHVTEVLVKKSGANLAYARSLSVERRDEPLLAVLMDNGGTLVVDGTHRMMRRWLDRCLTYRVIRVPLGLWEPFLIELPEALGRRLLE